MNNNLFFPSLWRFIGIYLVQVVFLHQVSASLGSYFNIYLYPLFIFLLPIQLATPYAVLIGTLMGYMVDFAYGTPGVHASAGAFSGYARAIVFYTFAPKGGFSGKELLFVPAYFGWQLFVQAISIFLAAHIFWYFSVSYFTFVYVGAITLKTLASWPLSMLFVLLYIALFNPKI
ncbi:MAG: hypothetical protein KGS48_10290 [Bacteroidetes bacterium]|nr:hypothetical protein [Bacteroidota bacterium]